ncbi:MAG: hypothetical protein HQL82_12310, partial [Magnetococcales bacterium]|nr:hypothetical protein [Magnetococcales bacterium]
GDSITIQSRFANDHYRVEELQFADGTLWTLDQIGLTILGTDNDDVMAGSNVGDTFKGLGGNDTLDGGDGLDAYFGGDGDDLLGGVVNSPDYHSATTSNGKVRGNDYTGGLGNDTLRGTKFGDFYYFNAGDGQDRIIENESYGWDTVYADRILLGTGLTAADLHLTRSGNDLVVAFDNGDSITIQSRFANDHYRVEELQFADGTLWTLDQIGLTVSGTPATDSLTGTSRTERLNGLDGDDLLDGAGGDDVLDGGNGDDLYRMDIGNGADLIKDSAGLDDQVLFGSGITAADLWFWRNGQNLEIGIIDQADRLTIDSWYAEANGPVECFRLDDDAVLLQNQVDQLVQAMATFAPSGQGSLTIPIAIQEDAAAVIAASWQTA